MDILSTASSKKNAATKSTFVFFIPALFFFIHLSGDHVFNKTNTLKMVLLLIVCTVLLISKLISKHTQQQPALLLLLLSPLLATFPGLAISQGQYSYSFPYEFIGQLLCVIWCYLLILIPNALNTPKQITYLFIPVIIYVCSVGLFEKVGLHPLTRFFINPFEANWQHGPEIFMGPVSRVKSTFGNINYFASFLIQLIPLCFVLIYILCTQNKSLSNVNRAAAIALAILVLSSLLFTGTRAAIMALVVSISLVCILTLFFYKRAISLYVLISVIALVPLVFFILSNYDQRFNDLLSINAWHSRVMPWQTAISSIKEAPFFGYGLGSSYELFFNFMNTDASIRISNGSYNHVHAEPLEILQEGGVFGLLAYIVFWGWVFVTAGRFIKDSNNPSNIRLIAAAISCGLMAYHIHGLFSVAPRMIPARLTAYSLVALLLVLSKQNRPTKNPYNQSNLPVYFMAASIVTSLAWLAPYAKSQYLYSKALASSTPDTKMIELAKTSEDVYTLYKAALSATELNDPKALNSITGKLNQIFPHFRKTDYLSAYNHLLENEIGDVKIKALKAQTLNAYQVDIGILLAGVAITQQDTAGFKKQFSIALKAIACKAQAITCESTRVKTVMGNMHLPIQFMIKPNKLTAFIDHSLFPHIYKKADVPFIDENSAFKALTLEYAKLLGSSDFFKPSSLSRPGLNKKDHQAIEAYIKAHYLLANSSTVQKNAYLSSIQPDDSLADQVRLYYEFNDQFVKKSHQANKIIEEAEHQLSDKLNMPDFLKRRELQLQLATWLAQSTQLASAQLDKHNPSRKIPNAL